MHADIAALPASSRSKSDLFLRVLVGQAIAISPARSRKMTSYCSIVWKGPVVSNLLDPDYWETVWNKLIDPGFWAEVWSKLIDPDFWLTAWKTFSAPEVTIPLIPLLLIALYLGVKIKGAIEARKIKGMKAQMDAANERLLLANEQRTAGAAVEREVETLRKQVADLKMRFETGAQHNDLATSVGAVTQTMAKLSSANDELQHSFIKAGPSVASSTTVLTTTP
jgi:hypothetical protein